MRLIDDKVYLKFRIFRGFSKIRNFLILIMLIELKVFKIR